MLLSRKFLQWQAAAALAVVASLFVLPGAPVASTAIALIAIWAITAGSYRLNPFRSSRGAMLLLGVWTALSLLTVTQIWWCTTHFGATCTDPQLYNFDSHKYMWMAQHVLDGDYERLYFMTAGLGYACIAWVFGVSLVPFTLASTLSVMLTLVLAGYIGGASAPEADTGKRYSTSTMAMCACVAFLMALGALMLKDAIAIAGLTMAAAAAVMTRRTTSRRGLVGAMALFAFGCVLIMFMRTQSLAFAALGALMLMRLRRRGIIMAGVYVAFAAACYIFFRNLDIIAGDYDPLTRSLTVADDGQWFLTEQDAVHAPYYALAKRYFFEFPLWLKVLCLPVCCCVQYFIPFFWTAGADVAMGPAMVYAHMGFGWYAVGGLILYTLLFKFRRTPGLMQRLTLWGVVVWVAPAFISAGLVSRYFLSAVPLLAPAAAAAWLQWRRERSFRIYAEVYIVLVIAALSAAYIITR